MIRFHFHRIQDYMTFYNAKYAVDQPSVHTSEVICATFTTLATIDENQFTG